MSLDRNDDDRLAFRNGGHEVGAVVVKKLEVTRCGLATREVSTPDTARVAGYDSTVITPIDGDFA